MMAPWAPLGTLPSRLPARVPLRNSRFLFFLCGMPPYFLSVSLQANVKDAGAATRSRVATATPAAVPLARPYALNFTGCHPQRTCRPPTGGLQGPRGVQGPSPLGPDVPRGGGLQKQPNKSQFRGRFRMYSCLLLLDLVCSALSWLILSCFDFALAYSGCFCLVLDDSGSVWASSGLL